MKTSSRALRPCTTACTAITASFATVMVYMFGSTPVRLEVGIGFILERERGIKREKEREKEKEWFVAGCTKDGGGTRWMAEMRDTEKERERERGTQREEREAEGHREREGERWLKKAAKYENIN